jgi:pimeloyl-ACP methyl ester carboxylesterase
MKLLAEAMEADLPYVIDCPVILICGEKDRAGSAKSYNRRWAKRERIPIHWIREAGHNSNTDKPEEVNQIIRDFARSIQEESHE